MELYIPSPHPSLSKDFDSDHIITKIKENLRSGSVTDSVITKEGDNYKITMPKGYTLTEGVCDEIKKLGYYIFDVYGSGERVDIHIKEINT